MELLTIRAEGKGEQEMKKMSDEQLGGTGRGRLHITGSKSGKK